MGFGGHKALFCEKGLFSRFNLGISLRQKDSESSGEVWSRCLMIMKMNRRIWMNGQWLNFSLKKVHIVLTGRWMIIIEVNLLGSNKYANVRIKTTYSYVNLIPSYLHFCGQLSVATLNTHCMVASYVKHDTSILNPTTKLLFVDCFSSSH